MATLAAAQAAKADLQRKLRGQPWFRGVDFTQLKCLCADPYELQVIVDTSAHLQSLLACPQTPKSWLGVPVSYSLSVSALGATGVAAQDYANVAMGALIAVGTFMMGKIAVGAIIESRKEHFDKKGQPPAAVKAKETTLDGVVKLAATAFSVYQITQQFPEVVAEVRGYFK